MMGDCAVGKTYLVLRYTKNTFSPEYKRSLGTSFAVKHLQIKGHALNVLIWDIAGQPSFDQVRRHYYAGAHGALLVFDVTNPATFMTLLDWYNDFKNISPKGSVVLVGNKMDLDSERCVTSKVSKMLQTWWNIPYVETSCLTGVKVEEAFLSLITPNIEKKIKI